MHGALQSCTFCWWNILGTVGVLTTHSAYTSSIYLKCASTFCSTKHVRSRSTCQFLRVSAVPTRSRCTGAGTAGVITIYSFKVLRYNLPVARIDENSNLHPNTHLTNFFFYGSRFQAFLLHSFAVIY